MRFSRPYTIPVTVPIPPHIISACCSKCFINPKYKILMYFFDHPPQMKGVNQHSKLWQWNRVVCWWVIVSYFDKIWRQIVEIGLFPRLCTSGVDCNNTLCVSDNCKRYCYSISKFVEIKVTHKSNAKCTFSWKFMMIFWINYVIRILWGKEVDPSRDYSVILLNEYQMRLNNSKEIK